VTDAGIPRLSWHRLAEVVCPIVRIGVASVTLVEPTAPQLAFRQIQAGMTEAEITELLGPPWPFRLLYTFRTNGERWGRPESVASYQRWSVGHGLVSVGFDKDGRAVTATLQEHFFVEEDLLTRMRRWVGL